MKSDQPLYVACVYVGVTGEGTEKAESLWLYHTMQNALSILMGKAIPSFLPKSEYPFLLQRMTVFLYQGR